MSAIERLTVVAGILCRADDDHILLTERIGDSPFAGLWEFPGGKIDPPESPEQALVRELREELGIDISRWSHFLSLDHEYADRCVSLTFYLVEAWAGIPAGLDGQALRWVARDALRSEELLPADAPVVDALHKLGPENAGG